MLELQRQEILRALAAFGDRFIDPEDLLLRLPASLGPPCHDTGRAAWHFPLKESLLYALVLLELADRSRQGLSEQILTRVIGLQQVANPDSSNFGTWPDALREAGAPTATSGERSGSIAFNGMILAIIWQRHHRRLTPATLARLKTSSLHAAAALARRRDAASRLGGAFVFLQAADHSTETRFLDTALARLANLAKSRSSAPASASAFIDELLAFAALRDHAARHPVIKRLPLLLERIATRLESVGASLPRDLSTALTATDDDLGALFNLIVVRSGVQPAPVSRPCTDLRACLPCIMKTWIPVSLLDLHRLTGKRREPRLVGAAR